MASGRPVLPKLFNAPTAGVDRHAYHPSNVKLTTQRKVSVACRICQARRTKCDGARPQCGACNSRHSQCGYPTRAGQSHSQARKQKMQQLESEKGVMLDVLCHLQTTSPEAAGDMLQKLRSIRIGDIEAMLACIERDRSEPSSQETLDSSKMEMDGLNELPRGLSAATTLADYERSPSSTRSHDLNVTLSMCGTPSDREISLQDINASLNIFFTHATRLSHIFIRSEVAKVIEPITSTSGLTLIDLYSRPTSPRTAMELSELAGILAIGLIYLRASTPDPLSSSEVAAFYYDIAKRGLDSAIEHNALRAMKLCTLLAFYNLSLRPTVALAYIGMPAFASLKIGMLITPRGPGLGLNLGRDSGIDTSASTCSDEIGEQKSTLQILVHLLWSVTVPQMNPLYPPLNHHHHQYKHYVNTNRTQTNSWLSASMDFVPESLVVSLRLSSSSSSCTPKPPTTPLQALEAQVIKITLIKRNILHSPCPDTTTLLPSTAVASYREKLRTYYAELPPWMSLAHLHASSSSSSSSANGIRNAGMVLDKETRKTVLHVHLFYMGTMMALARRIVASYYYDDVRRGEEKGGGEGRGGSMLDRVPRESRQAIEEGFVAAQMSARVLDLMLEEEGGGGNIDACWVCIYRFTAYTSSIMLCYHAAQDLLSGFSPAENLDLISRCLRILTCCAQRDRIATGLLASVGMFATVLQAFDREGEGEVTKRARDGQGYVLGDVIFRLHLGKTELHDVARELVGLVGKGVRVDGGEK